MIRETVDRIRTSLKSGQFTNEASISQGVVLPVLQALDWPVFDTSVVTPEYSVESGRVDYALRETTGRPKIFVEVKRLGQTNTGDRQLFEYAFHQGVPMAVLTDGHEWSFYLPGEEGQYEERRVYKLDLLERSPAESTERLHRYLNYGRVISGEALSAARNDYRNVARDRLIGDSMPRAWHQLLSGSDEILVELLADKVEDICGYKPEPDVCSQFIQTKADPQRAHIENGGREQQEPPSRPSPRQDKGFTYRGEFHSANSAREVLRRVLITFAEDDPEFLGRFAERKHGRTRRWIARSKNELNPDRPDLAEKSVELVQGWWMGTNYSRRRIEKIAKLACEVANVEIGKDLVVSL